jgi:tetratricopeptide (TPR) repeat protein
MRKKFDEAFKATVVLEAVKEELTLTKLAEKYKGDEEKYGEALYYLADAYESFGFPEEAIEVYKKLLELERKRGDKKEEALTLAHMAINYEELDDLDRAIELMNRARELFEELGGEEPHSKPN